MSAPATVLDFRTRRSVDDRPPGTRRLTLELSDKARDEFAALATYFIKENEHRPGMDSARCFLSTGSRSGRPTPDA